jgi:hypothetical protein
MVNEPGPDAGSSASGDGSSPDDVCFVIGRPRSGTTVFRNMLETHPEMFGVGEIFNESNPRSYFHFLQRRQTQDTNALLPSRAIDNFIAYVQWCRKKSLERRPGSRFVILDAKYDQAHLLCVPWWAITSLPKLFSLIREQKWRVIDIHRQNVVGMFVSNHVAIKTGIYHSTDLGREDRPRAKVHVDPDALMRHVTATSQAYRRVGEHFRGYDKYLNLSYEEMFDDGGKGEFRAALLDRLSEFFVVESLFDPVPKLSKLLTEDPYAYVENAEQIRDVLRRNNMLPRP